MGRPALRAAVLLWAVGLGLAAPLRGARSPALLETSSGSGETPEDDYYKRDKLGLTVFDYDRLNIQRGSLDDPADAGRAGEEAQNAEANQAEAAGAVEGNGPGSAAEEAANQVKQRSENETPPEVLRAVERRKALQRWLTFKKVKQTCPTFPFCNHIPPPPPMKPSPISLAHPQGLVHYPFVHQGQTPLPPEFDPKSRRSGAVDGAGGGNKKKKKGLLGKVMSSVKGALVGSSSRKGEGKKEKGVSPGAAMYAGKVQRRWKAPFQRASRAPYEFEATFYNPPVGRVQDPKGPDLSRDGVEKLPRSESPDPDVQVRSRGPSALPPVPRLTPAHAENGHWRYPAGRAHRGGGPGDQDAAAAARGAVGDGGHEGGGDSVPRRPHGRAGGAQHGGRRRRQRWRRGSWGKEGHTEQVGAGSGRRQEGQAATPSRHPAPITWARRRARRPLPEG